MIEFYELQTNTEVLEINRENNNRLGYCGLYYMISKDGFYYVDHYANRIEPGDFMVHSSYKAPKVFISRTDLITGLFNNKYGIR